MFNTKVERHSHHYGGGNTNVTVTEHRAPTDESIRLAEEMRDKTLNRILYSEGLNNNTFNYRLAVLAECGFYTKIKITAIINGKVYSAEENICNLQPQEYEQAFDEDGNVCSRKKFNFQEIVAARKRMLVKLLCDSLYEANNEEFHRLDERIGNGMFDHWSLEDYRPRY